MKIVSIVGARPQFVKYCPVSKAIGKFNKTSGENIRDVLIHTGQHYAYTMSKIFFDELGIREPEYHLDVGSGTNGAQTAQVLQKAEEVLMQEKPDIVLVYGDTNSTMGGALAASKLHVPIAHIEAGLRSYNKKMPEEINRVLTDHISTVLFCPTETAVRNLEKEGFSSIIDHEKLAYGFSRSSPQKSPFVPDISRPVVLNVGDVMFDVLMTAVEIAESRAVGLEGLALDGEDYALLTIHRAENTDNPENFHEILDFVNRTSEGKPVVFPMHPRTKKIYEKLENALGENVRTIGPVGYFEILTLLKHSRLLMTDSGGMQKEAFWLQVPCITLRNDTEWTETVESGWNILFRNYPGFHSPQKVGKDHYGDGRAAEKIISAIYALTGKAN
jgi:UDP-GlcNAc3NAcA epimerase